MSSYADDLEAKAKAATARPFKPIEIKGNGFYQTAGDVRNLDGKSVMHYCVCATCTTFPRPEGLALVGVFIDLANHVEDFVRLLRAAEATREQLQRDFAIKCRCDFVTKLFAGIERCVGCRARDTIAMIDDALAAFEEATR